MDKVTPYALRSACVAGAAALTWALSVKSEGDPDWRMLLVAGVAAATASGTFVGATAGLLAYHWPHKLPSKASRGEEENAK